MTRRLIPILLIGLTLGAYHGSYSVPFILDDEIQFVNNPYIRHLKSPEKIIAHSTRPLVHLSLAVNYALGGLNPWGYHLVNVGIHILAALVLYGVVRRTVESKRLGWKGAVAAPWLAGVVALLWALHPLQTQSVTYVIQRGELLMGLFYLLTLYCVIHSHESAWRILWAAGAVVSCALGMASKQVMVTAPVVVLLYDRVFLAGSWREVRRQRWWLYAGMAVTWLLLRAFMAHEQAEVPDWEPMTGFAYRGISPPNYLLTQAGVIVHYLRLALWPDRLCFDYGTDWPVAQTVQQALPWLIVVGGLLAVTAWSWRQRPTLGFIGVWFFTILSPTSSFVPIADVVVEHRMYMSLAAVVTLVVVGVRELIERASRRQQWGAVTQASLASAGVLIFMILTIQRVTDYRSVESIWNDTVTKRPGNFRAHNNLGKTLADQGRTVEALTHYRQALRLKPDYPLAHNNLGNALIRMGQTTEAITHYREALRLKPNFLEAQNNLGAVLVADGQTAEAITHFLEALRLKPDFPDALNNLGLALAARGQTTEAITHYLEALRLKPDFSEAHFNLGTALAKQGKTSEAITHYREALRLKSDNSEAHSNLGNALARLGQTTEAITHYREALRLKPKDSNAHFNLGVVLAGQGLTAEAITHFRQALESKADNIDALFNLAIALQQSGGLEEAIDHYEEILSIRPNFLTALNNLAWIRATNADPRLRDGAEAVRLAEHACQLHGQNKSELFDTLAASYAEAGRFLEAVSTAERALELAKSANQSVRTSLVDEIQSRLALYRAGQPYRESTHPN